MMALYNTWMDVSAQMRLIAEQYKEGSAQRSDILSRAEQLEACAQDLLKAYLSGDP